jgi:hypothetical protein
MSGGSYNYIYTQIQELAGELRNQATDPRRAAFAKLLDLVGEAMGDIEWVDSSDYGPGDDHKSIDAVFAFLTADPEIIKKAHAYDRLISTLRDFLK